MENNNDLFEFIGDDIYSSSSSVNDNFEDIVSNSKLKGKHFAKKKRKNRFTRWWSRRRKWQKAVMISAVSLVTALAVTVGVLLTVFDYNYNNITGNPDDLGFESVIDKKITIFMHRFPCRYLLKKTQRFVSFFMADFCIKHQKTLKFTHFHHIYSTVSSLYAGVEYPV